MGESILDNRVEEFEKKANLILPVDYKYFIKQINGLSLLGNEILGIGNKQGDLIETYYWEHNEVKYPIFSNLIPFSPDGGGNFYCFDTSKYVMGICPIVFWVSNYIYTNEDQPEIVNESFIEFLKEVFIDWVLESFDYDGESK
jgi:hypothetical protein